MKKFLWWILIIVSLLAIGLFVVLPTINNYLDEQKKAKEEAQSLTGKEQISVSLFKDGWIKEEVYVAQRKDIPTLENDFYALGYPQFLYLPGKNGGISKDDNSGEKSTHEDGMQVYLYMDSSYYMTNAKIEVPVNAKSFNSTAIKNYMGPFCDFIKVITNKELSTEDQNNLSRKFAEAFNDAEKKAKKITLNGITFTITLDYFYNLIIMEC